MTKVVRFLLFFCATIMWCAATTVAFGQAPAASQGARLRAYTTVMPQTAPASRSASSIAARTSSSMLPLWTFNVSSSRDHNNYTGVMVGRNPFGGGPKKANVPTQIVPIVITTHLIGTAVDFSSGNVTHHEWRYHS